MELLIGTMCFGAITFYGYLMAKYIDAREERKTIYELGIQKKNHRSNEHS